MNVACISTLDKFSRFYLDIENHLKTLSNNSVKLKVFSIHSSGFLYTLMRFKFSLWLPVKAWYLAKKNSRFYKKIIITQTTYKGITYNNYLDFHQKLSNKIPIQQLQLQALAYIDIFTNQFEKFKPDYLITIGDTRLSIEIAIAIAKKKNIKVFYIEQGPFKTTFFDNIGVNANISIRQKTFSDNALEKENIETLSKSNIKSYRRSPFYRGIDILLMTFFEKTNIYPPDLKFTDVNSYQRKSLNKTTTNFLSKKHQNIALLILQVPLDVNMIKHSPHFKSHFEIVKAVFNNLPPEMTLVIREHPLYINKYNKELYNFIAKNDIVVENNIPINTALENSDVVIVNNSTVGIEAIAKYKTVVVLGNAFYDNSYVCLKLKAKDDLSILLKQALQHQINKIIINKFISYLYKTVLINGPINAKDLNSSREIANRLIANL